MSTKLQRILIYKQELQVQEHLLGYNFFSLILCHENLLYNFTFLVLLTFDLGKMLQKTILVRYIVIITVLSLEVC